MSAQPAVVLRPIEEADLDLLLRLIWDPEANGEYQWFGFRMELARRLRRRWHDDGLLASSPGPSTETASFLAVGLADGTAAGWVTWRSVGGSGNLEIGVALFPEHRGHGIGTTSHRQLVELLFATTSAHRLQAGTEVANVAEQRALEKAGLQREGVQRGVTFRAGQWRNSVLYGFLRDDLGEHLPV